MVSVERIWVQWRGQRIRVPRDLVCQNGHQVLGDSWALCSDCGNACKHFRCRECDTSIRDPEHVCHR